MSRTLKILSCHLLKCAPAKTSIFKISGKGLENDTSGGTTEEMI
jgi:hypothetical protein